MKKKLIFSLLVLAGVPSLSMAVDEARLLRFPATNGKRLFSRMRATSTRFRLRVGEAGADFA